MHLNFPINFGIHHKVFHDFVTHRDVLNLFFVHHDIVCRFCIWWWSVGSMACRIPIFRFEQHCSTEATIGFCFAYCCNIRALLFLLDTDIFVSNLFRYPEILAHLWVLSAVLLPIDPSPKSPFLQHRISHGELPWNKYEFTKLAHWLDYWPNVSLIQPKSNLS